MRYSIRHYSVIILAAGRSSRLGSPKQLLTYKNVTLLEHTIDSALHINASSVIVVLGSNKDLIQAQIKTQGIIISENTSWESGIASSIKTGLNAIELNAPQTDAIILMVCDQPFADHAVLQAIIDLQQETGKPVVGCTYEGTHGTPALFHSSLFPDLMELKGDNGAKKLFEKYQNKAAFVPFDRGGIDIDTSEDYHKLAK